MLADVAFRVGTLRPLYAFHRGCDIEKTGLVYDSPDCCASPRLLRATTTDRIINILPRCRTLLHPCMRYLHLSKLLVIKTFRDPDCHHVIRKLSLAGFTNLPGRAYCSSVTCGECNSIAYRKP